jgi:hypothetical protein
MGDCERGEVVARCRSAIVAGNAQEDAAGEEPVSTPEQQARAEIDRLLQAAGWAVQSVDMANLHAACGVAIREFPLNPGYGFADWQ